MQGIERNSWHGRLFAWSYSAFDQQVPKQFDIWLYGTTVLGALVFLACGAVICIILNIGTIPFGVFVEPIWRPDARFRRLAFPGGIPIISVALPILLAYAGWCTWVARGPIYAIAPFVLTAAMGFSLLGCFVVFNRLRRRLAPLSFAVGESGDDR
jgi:hypothetical protein